jgi:hypothetical protein
VENDVHAVGCSSLAAGHKTLVPEIVRHLHALGADDIIVFVGGVIPAQDYDALYAAGAKGIFGPGTPIQTSAREVLRQIRAAQGVLAAAKPMDGVDMGQMYQALFKELGISYKTDESGQIRSDSPLGFQGQSLQLYFNRATRNRREYLAGAKRYERYQWEELWEPAGPNAGDCRNDYLTIRPKASQERQAVEDILRFAKTATCGGT